MPNYQIATVDFHSHDIWTAHDGDHGWTSPKALCEVLGVDWSSQLSKLKAHPIFGQGMAIIAIPSGGGLQETAMLRLDLLQGWLLSIDPRRVKDGVRERLILFQMECYQVLHDYWTKGSVRNPRIAQIDTKAPDFTRSASMVLRLMREVKAPQPAAQQTATYDLLVKACHEAGITPPTLVGLLAPHDLVTRLAEPVFAAMTTLEAMGEPVSHARRADRIAVRPAELETFVLRQDLDVNLGPDVWRALRAHPRFIATTAVNSRWVGRSVHCWVFKREGPALRLLPAPNAR